SDGSRKGRGPRVRRSRAFRPCFRCRYLRWLSSWPADPGDRMLGSEGRRRTRTYRRRAIVKEVSMATRPIVVGYDGSQPAEAALAWALDEADRSRLPVRLVYAFEWFGLGTPVAAGVAWPDPETRRQAEAMVLDAATQARESHPDLDITGVLVDGPAAGVLTERSRDAALIVLGNRGHGGFANLLLGSTGVAV